MFQKHFLVALILSLVSSIALAQAVQAPTAAQIEQKKEECRQAAAKNPPSVINNLALDACIKNVDLKAQEFRLLAAGSENAEFRKGIEKEISHLKILLDSLEKSIKGLSAAQQKPQPAPQAPQPPADQPQQAQQAPVPPAPMMMGVPFQVIEVEGRNAAVTRDLPQMGSRWEIVHIAQAGQHFLGQQDPIDMRVVVMKNGRPLAVTDPSPDCMRNPRLQGCFTEFFADLNHDGVPEAFPYRGIDPAFVNVVYIAIEPKDRVEFVYLTAQPFKKVAANGIPPQPFWGNPVKVSFGKARKVGRFSLSAHAAID